MTDNRTYTPLLRWKRGEQVALAALTAATKTNITPLIMLTNEQFKHRKATTKTEAKTAAKAFCDEVKSTWGDGEFKLYAADLVPPDDEEASPLLAVGVAAAEAGLKLVPVVRLDDPEDYQIAAVEVANAGSGAIGLRINLGEMGSASEWIDTVAPESTDLIIDFGDNISMASQLGGVLADAFARLEAGPAWRSVTIAGSSIPDDFTGIAAGPHRIARQELAVWRALRKRSLPYPLFFGDYATISPNARTPGVRWGYPINVKYTLEEEFLVCRGIRTLGLPAKKDGTPGKKVPTMDMGPQLIGHAKTIVDLPDRDPLPNCWGDAQIDKIANGEIGPGGLPEWVQYSVNRHIEFTVSQLI